MFILYRIQWRCGCIVRTNFCINRLVGIDSAMTNSVRALGPNGRHFPVCLPPVPDENYDDANENERRRQENIRAMLQNDLQLVRKPLVPKLLQVKQSELALRQPFKTPHPSGVNRSDALMKKLLARKK